MSFHQNMRPDARRARCRCAHASEPIGVAHELAHQLLGRQQRRWLQHPEPAERLRHGAQRREGRARRARPAHRLQPLGDVLRLQLVHGRDGLDAIVGRAQPRSLVRNDVHRAEDLAREAAERRRRRGEQKARPRRHTLAHPPPLARVDERLGRELLPHEAVGAPLAQRLPRALERSNDLKAQRGGHSLAGPLLRVDKGHQV
mmetsp:Transcript_48751/g.157924  ORF Transcript_48751/g.157924 Transcript_48751/m.157924 type:complete len:201 (+) Transcript_48751:59-661(+)